MAANRRLVEERGLGEYEVSLIDQLHTLFDSIASNSHLYEKEELEESLHAIEFALQRLWGFEEDSSFHARTGDILFKLRWAGVRVVCIITGEEFIIPDNVEMGDFYSVGEGFIDVGDPFYFRVGGVTLDFCDLETRKVSAKTPPNDNPFQVGFDGEIVGVETT